ncbi:MAG TPA: FAD-dependent thymidylate synthase [Candidatus Saccharimonadales bacterium]|nr:FAD-dependent thymidylate synthase [Candidatus Saccharimonadales bacterium]
MDTSKSGIFIVIEGTDGSGKATQFALLKERLLQAGYDVATFDFPQYDQPSSYFVRQYLNGAYNNGGIPGPYTASLFYALDRYEAAPQIRQALNEGKIVLANRYTGSNMAHQGTKLASPEERRGYFIWNDNLEFEMLHIPRPNISYILRVPADIAQGLVDQKGKRSYTDKARDLHEDDIDHLRKSVEVYDDLAQLFPKDFVRIDCVRDNKLLGVDAVNEILWQKIQPMLPEAPKTKADKPAAAPASSTSTQAPTGPEPENSQPARADTITPNPEPEPILRQDETGAYVLTETGRQFLGSQVTNSASSIYALTGKLGPELTAALVARFTHRAGDLRSTLLLEFAAAAERDQALVAHDAFAAYGDASVGQLASAYLVLGNVSNMLAKQVEHSRLAAFVEQSAAVSRHEAKNPDGTYNYYVPETLSEDTTNTYCQYMDRIFDTYTDILEALTIHFTETGTPHARAEAARIVGNVLPIATKTTIVVYASAQALEGCITSLLSEDLPEARETGLQMLAEARKVLPSLLAQTDKSDHGGAQIVYHAGTNTAVRTLAQAQLSDNHAPQAAPVRLSTVWPRNEFDLLPNMVYPHTNRPLQDIAGEIANWPYDKKAEIFEAYMGDRTNRRLRPGRALEHAHYTWDIVSDYTVFRDLQQHNIVEDMQSQLLTPRYGYDVPQIIEDAGLADQFESCFDASLELYSLLQQAGHPREAQYATLMGHKLRYKLTYNAREAFHIHELHTTKHASPATRQLVQLMHEKLAEVHPIIGEAMKFVQTN